MENKRRDPQNKIFTSQSGLRRHGGEFLVQVAGVHIFFLLEFRQARQGCRDAFCQSDGRAQAVA